MGLNKPHVDPKYGECHSHSPYSMPIMFDPLAVYNAEVTRGIIHYTDYTDKMVDLQGKFDEWTNRTRCFSPNDFST